FVLINVDAADLVHRLLHGRHCFPPLTVSRTAGWNCLCSSVRFDVSNLSPCRRQAAMPCVLPLGSARTTLFQASRKQSTSSSVVENPKLTRIAPRARPESTPMAESTCEAATLPDEQAAPEDTATPARSSAIRAVSARMPGTAKAVV